MCSFSSPPSTVVGILDLVDSLDTFSLSLHQFEHYWVADLIESDPKVLSLHWFGRHFVGVVCIPASDHPYILIQIIVIVRLIIVGTQGRQPMFILNLGMLPIKTRRVVLLRQIIAA